MPKVQRRLIFFMTCIFYLFILNVDVVICAGCGPCGRPHACFFYHETIAYEKIRIAEWLPLIQKQDND